MTQQNEIYEMALDLLDFCEMNLSVKEAEEFWKWRQYDVTPDTKTRVFNVAYNLLSDEKEVRRNKQ